MKLSIYDLDRTVYRGDTFKDLWGFLYDRKVILQIGKVAILVKYFLFLTNIVSLKNFKETVLSCLDGYDRENINKLMNDFVGGIHKEDFRAELIKTIKQEKDEGYRLVMLTASPDIYAVKIGKRLGFDDVLSTVTEFHGEVFTGKIVGEDLRGKVKVDVLMRWKESNPFDMKNSKGYGNKDDLPWLDMLGEKKVYD